ncbi:MAG: hypothetical protein GX303_04405 [Clostridiales bacterium]|nr:hypothetical protein [Clostridiales bacterium]
MEMLLTAGVALALFALHEVMHQRERRRILSRLLETKKEKKTRSKGGKGAGLSVHRRLIADWRRVE